MNSKTYTFQDPIFTIEVPVTTAFCAFLIPYGIYHMVKGDLLTPPLLAFFVVAAIYQVWNVVVSAAHPKDVIVDDESISFCLYGRQDRYELDQISDLHVRSNAHNGKLFIRINKPTIFRGRYWVNTQDFNDGRELFNLIEDLEVRVHPDGLKAKARRSNEKYLEDAAKREEKENAEEPKRLSAKDKKKRGARAREAAAGTKAEEKE